MAAALNLLWCSRWIKVRGQGICARGVSVEMWDLCLWVQCEVGMLKKMMGCGFRCK